MYVPTRVFFGAGQLSNLHAQKMPGKKAMIVIPDGKSARTNGYLARTEEQLKIAGVESVLFDKVEANPLKTTVMCIYTAVPIMVKKREWQILCLRVRLLVYQTAYLPIICLGTIGSCRNFGRNAGNTLGYLVPCAFS